MNRSPYPKGTFVFEVLCEGPIIRKGAIVEGLGVGVNISHDFRDLGEDLNFLGVRVSDSDMYPDETAVYPRLRKEYRKRIGFYYVGVMKNQVRPISVDAHDMLALVKP